MKKYLKENWAREKQSMQLDEQFSSLYEELSNFQSENARGTLFQQCKKPASFSVVEKASVQSSILSVDWSTDEGIFVQKNSKMDLYQKLNQIDFIRCIHFCMAMKIFNCAHP